MDRNVSPRLYTKYQFQILLCRGLPVNYALNLFLFLNLKEGRYIYKIEKKKKKKNTKNKYKKMEIH